MPSSTTDQRRAPSKRVSRRAVLRGAAVPIALSLAGCGERRGDADEPLPLSELLPDLPVEERGDVLAAGVADGTAITSSDAESFERSLSEAGLRVESVESREGQVDIKYLVDWSDGLLYSVGLVGGAYAALTTTGYPAAKLRATILDEDDRDFGEFTAEIDWTRRLGDDLTEEEYGALVADTLETVA